MIILPVIATIVISDGPGFCAPSGQEKTTAGYRGPPAATKNGAASMKAQKEIERIRGGGRFEGDLRPFTDPDAEALDLLASELRQNNAVPVRDQIVRILVSLAKQPDPSQRIRNPRIVAIFLNDGATHADGPFMHAMAELAEHATPEALAEFRPTLGRLAAKAPVPDLFLVIAKAKAREALPAMRKLEKEDRWAKDDRFRIALAALGDHTHEAYFTGRFRATTTPKEKVALAEKLSKIGTASALKALAEEMRSPLVVSIPGSFEFSVRVEIAKALWVHYPDKPFLSAIKTEADYDRVEKFCEREFGVTWSTPRPPFLVFRELPADH